MSTNYKGHEKASDLSPVRTIWKELASGKADVFLHLK